MIDNTLMSKKSTSGGGVGSDLRIGHTQQYKKWEFTKDKAGLMSWIQSFAVYTAIVCSQDASKFNDLLAYTVIMIDERRHFKFEGWLTYL